MVSRKRLTAGAAITSSILLLSTAAWAHVSIQTKAAFAGTNQVITFGVGHGCEGADTVKIEIHVPKEVTTVRAMPSVWGEPEVTRDDADVITSIAWSKSEPHPGDDLYYEFALRIRVPDAPFSTVLFPVTQTCRSVDGKESTVEWAATPEEVAAAKEGEEPEPAATLNVVPARVTGWNKYTVKNKITDLAAFADAQIVWAGDAAYSANPATMELIKGEDDVEELTEIKAGAEIWVKY